MHGHMYYENKDITNPLPIYPVSKLLIFINVKYEGKLTMNIYIYTDTHIFICIYESQKPEDLQLFVIQRRFQASVYDKKKANNDTVLKFASSCAYVKLIFFFFIFVQSSNMFNGPKMFKEMD